MLWTGQSGWPRSGKPGLELIHVIHILPPVVDIAGDVYADVEQAQLATAHKHLKTVLSTKAEGSSVLLGSHVRRGVPFSGDL